MDIDLGKIAPTPKNAWNPADSGYEFLDVVSYNGSSYLAIWPIASGKIPTGTLPTNTTYWQLSAGKGDKGEQGANAIQGIATPSGSATGNRFTGETWSINTVNYGSTFINFGNITVPLKVGVQNVINARFVWNNSQWNLQYELQDAANLPDYVSKASLKPEVAPNLSIKTGAIANTGNINDYATDYNRSERIDVFAGDVLKASLSYYFTSSADNTQINLYSKTGIFIAQLGSVSGKAINQWHYINQDIIIPSDGFVILSSRFKNSNGNAPGYVFTATVSTDKYLTKSTVVNELDKKLNDPINITGKIVVGSIGSDGEFGTSADYVRTEKIPVDVGDFLNISFTINYASSPATQVRFYNENGVFVSNLGSIGTQSTNQWVNINFDLSIHTKGYIAVFSRVAKSGVSNSTSVLPLVKKNLEKYLKKSDASTLIKPKIISANPKFEFIRLGLIFTRQQGNAPTLTAGSIINTVGMASPLGKYYMYYSTDHSYTDSFIGMAYSNDLISWINYGVIFNIANSGIPADEPIGPVGHAPTETETPCVVWNPIAKKYYMYWQTDAHPVYRQSSRISESVDGINWTYLKIAFDFDLELYPGDGHNGYVQILRKNGYFVASHQMGGTAYGFVGQSYSYDGLDWWTDRKVRNKEMHLSYAANVYTGGTVSALLEINGKNYNLSGSGRDAFGGNAKEYFLGIAELDESLFIYKGYALKVADMNFPFEEDDIRAVRTFHDEDGSVYIMYACGKDNILLGQLIAK